MPHKTLCNAPAGMENGFVWPGEVHRNVGSAKNGGAVVVPVRWTNSEPVSGQCEHSEQNRYQKSNR